MTASERKRAFLVQMVEVIPQAGSLLSNNDPTAKGAIVHCVIPAMVADEAMANLLQALADDHYKFVKSEPPIDLGCDGDWVNQDTPDEILEMAAAAFVQNAVVYGPFHCW